MNNLKKIIVCPVCLKGLSLKMGHYYCPECGRSYAVKEGIPVLVKGEIFDSQIQNKEYEWKRKEILVFDAVDDYEKFMSRPYFRDLKEQISQELKLLKDNKNEVLEVGAGISLFAPMFADKNLVLTDLSFSLLRKNEAHIFKVVADGEYLPFADQSFDFIYVIGLIHHLPNQRRGLKELKRLVRPGGQIFLSEPTKWSFNLIYYLVRRLLLKIMGERWLKRLSGCGTPYESFINLKLVKEIFKDDFEIKVKKIFPCRWPPLLFLEKMKIIVPLNKFWQKVPLVRNFGSIIFITLTRKKYYGV
ncbi:MAG: methyltransferase domain-containing protein [Patescibacteria group bacterium]